MIDETSNMPSRFFLFLSLHRNAIRTLVLHNDVSTSDDR